MLFALWSTAFAADWLTILGTEEGRKDEAVHIFGFIQPQFDGIVGGNLVGGERPIFNTVNGRGPASFVVRRARVALRGSLPKTDQRVSYFMMLEAGEVSVARGSAVVFTDMALTLSAPGARLRVGQFKLPVMEEVVQGVAGSLEFVNFSNLLIGLLLENDIDANGAFVGGSYGFRDVGVQVFEGFQEGSFAGSYAVMLSNGAGGHAVDGDTAKDLTVRGELAWVMGGDRTSGRRKEIKVGGWWLEGTRPIADGRGRRMRRGAFLHVENHNVWSLVEMGEGKGALAVGRAPPFPDGQAVVSEEGTAWGVVAQGGVRLPVKTTSVGLKGRFDQYHRRTDDREALRVFRTVTAGVEFNPVKTVRVQANYEFRHLSAPDGTEAAQTVAESMADRASVQLTARF